MLFPFPVRMSDIQSAIKRIVASKMTARKMKFAFLSSPSLCNLLINEPKNPPVKSPAPITAGNLGSSMPVAKYQLIRVKVKPVNPNSIPYLRSAINHDAITSSALCIPYLFPCISLYSHPINASMPLPMMFYTNYSSPPSLSLEIYR